MKRFQIIFTIIFILSVQCQAICFCLTDSLRPLKIGDHVPDYTFNTLLNYRSKSAKLSDFGNKLIILDFWNTGCASCVASWPHLMEIQNEFRDRIQIILVNPMQDEATVRKSFDRRKKIANVDVSLPAACADPNILKLFPVSGVPHIVWIDKDRIVRSITYSSSVNSKNVSALLNNEAVDMPQKIDNKDLVSAIFQKPLFIEGNGGRASEVYGYSFFGKGDEKLFPTYGLVSNAKRNEYYIVLTNYCIKDFYRLAYSNRVTHLGLEMVSNNRVLMQTADSIKYLESVGGEVIRDNLYVYQVISPPASITDLQRTMQFDLKRYIGLDAQWVKIKKKCLVLTASDTTLISYKGGDRRAVINDTSIKLNNVTMKYFLDFLEDATDYYWSPYPLIDETKFKGMLGGIEFETNVSDYRKLDEAFKRYGMRMKLEDRVIDVLLIRDSGNRTFFAP